MDDTLVCPICGNKLQNVRRSQNVPFFNVEVSYWERTCAGINHSIQFFTDTSTKKVDFLKISLNPQYSIFLEIDFKNQKCRINCMKEGQSNYLEIKKMIIPDFPLLTRLKERVSLYITFS